MSRQLLAVLRITINSTFGLSALRWRVRRRERLWEPLAVLFGIGVGGGVMAFGVYQLAKAMAAAGLTFGQPEISLGLATVGAQMMVLLMGFFMVVSAFYFSRDLAQLVPLPVTPGTIITAKFITLVIAEYLTIAVIYIPAVLGYAQIVPFGPLKALAAVLVFLLLPVLPLGISALAALLMMRSISRRQRDMIFYAGSLLLLGLVLVWQMALSRLPEAEIGDYLRELITSRFGVLRAIASRFPPSLWATLAVHSFPSAEGLRNLALTAGASLAAVAALATAGNALFYRGLIGGDEAGSARGQGRGRARTRAGAGRAAAAQQSLLRLPETPLRALIRREWLMLTRTPIWMLNNVLPGLLVPLFMFVPMLGQPQLREQIAQLPNLAGGFGIAGLIMAGFLLFSAGVAGVAPSAISREGGRFWVSRVIPQSAATQLQAKLMLSLGVMAVTSLPVAVGYAIIIRPPLLHLLLPVVIGLLAGASIAVFGLRIDASRPMLRWQDPAEPVKRNLNALFPMGITVVYIAAGAAISVAARRFGAPDVVIYAILLLAVGWSLAGLYRWTMNSAEGLFSRIDV